MMKNALNFFKIIRIQNLLFIVLIQYILRFSVVIPLIQASDIHIHSSGLDFMLMVLATVFIAAGGYIINDYYDIKIDQINKPEKVIVGTKISKKTAMNAYMIFSSIGVISGLLLSYRLKSSTLAFVFILIVGILWFYSASYKRQFLIGNLIIALLSGMTVLMVALIEFFYLYSDDILQIINPQISRNIFIWIGGFAVFSFLLTFIREIVKDMEDEYGDRQNECRTMPVVLGFSFSKTIAIILIIITIGCLFYAMNFIAFDGTLTLRYVIFGVVLPLLFVIYLIIKAKTKNDYKQISNFIKFIMLIGVLYAPIFHLLMAQKTGISFYNLF